MTQEAPQNYGDDTLYIANDPVVWGMVGVCDLDHIATIGGPWGPAIYKAVQ